MDRSPSGRCGHFPRRVSCARVTASNALRLIRPLALAVGVLVAVVLHSAPVAAACGGDCDGDGEVTVNELVLGVNIALGTAEVAQCPSLDADASDDVTINEIIAAVGNALNGCTGYAGHYQSTVALGGGRTGTLDMTVAANGTASGTFVIKDSEGLALARPLFGAQAVLASVSVSGSVDFSTGSFSISGSYVDGSGHTVAINIGGSLPPIAGLGTVTFVIGANVYSSTIAAVTTPTPTATAGSGTTHVVKVGQTNLPFDPELLVINVGDTVKWEWVAGTHSVVSGPNTFPPTCQADGVFDSGVQSSGTFSHTFTAPGDYGYHCGVGNHCANFESGEIQVLGTPTVTATATPKPTSTVAPTATATSTSTPATIGGVSTAMLGTFSGTAHNVTFGNDFDAALQISADASGAKVVDVSTTFALGGQTFNMTVETPTRLSFADPNPSRMVTLVVELVGPGHVTGTYTIAFVGMSGSTMTLDLMRVP